MQAAPIFQAAHPALVTGSVTDSQGKPIAGAIVDVWHSDDDGTYDVQCADTPAMRGRYRTDAQGRSIAADGRTIDRTYCRLDYDFALRSQGIEAGDRRRAEAAASAD